MIKDYEWKNNLRFVRIYFSTPTFDRIEKDRAAKFVDMLSAIGGTMGLLTGFSIISGVEIIYFATKFVWSIFQKNNIKMIKSGPIFFSQSLISKVTLVIPKSIA